jgi:hypothetical protein
MRGAPPPGAPRLLNTDIGWILVMATPAGSAGYEELARTADSLDRAFPTLELSHARTKITACSRR